MKSYGKCKHYHGLESRELFIHFPTGLEFIDYYKLLLSMC